MSSRGKAGISWPAQELTSDPVEKFFQHESKLSWHYNWNKNWISCLPHTSSDTKINAEFLPMIFSPEHLNNEFELQKDWKCLLGYNEPDHTDPAVAVHKRAAEAAAAWTVLAKLKTSPDLKLASPAIAGDMGWLEEFFALIPPESRPNYLAVHVYTTTFDDFKRRMEMYWKTFGLPIILTEFAMHNFVPDVPPPSSMQQVHDFMGATTEWLDQTDYVVKYAWFGACRDPANLHGVHPFNRLMDQQGDITDLGRQYTAGGHR